MITIFVLTLIFLFLPVVSSVKATPLPSDSICDVLDKLDDTIARKKEFHARKEARISDLRRRLALVTDTLEQYSLCKELSDEYQHY